VCDPSSKTKINKTTKRGEKERGEDSTEKRIWERKKPFNREALGKVPPLGKTSYTFRGKSKT